MKRVPELEPFSHDHHQGLVLARKARRAVEAGDDFAPVFAEIRERFRTELAPHFRVEEEFLAPALRAMGQNGPVDRLLDEHNELRTLCVEGEATASSLARFAQLLYDHIRWEERELFELAQQVLATHQLHAVYHGCMEAGLGKTAND